jgi:hypothetical protein
LGPLPRPRCVYFTREKKQWTWFLHWSCSNSNLGDLEDEKW